MQILKVMKTQVWHFYLLLEDIIYKLFTPAGSEFLNFAELPKIAADHEMLISQEFEVVTMESQDVGTEIKINKNWHDVDLIKL